MRKFPSAVVTVAAFLLLASVPALTAQSPAVTAAQSSSVEANRQAFATLCDAYWQAFLERSPEFASEIGDKRYNDRITDYSVQAENEWLEREQNYLMQLATIDPAGFTAQEKISRDLLLRQFADDQEAAEFKEWEMSVNQMDGIYDTYPQLAAELSFTTVKDYDDWIARLHALPRAFEQVTTNLSIGMEDGRVPPKYLLEKTLDEVNALAGQKPEDSPLALPLQHFPASIPPAEQARIRDEMLGAIGKEDLPAYQRFARFLKVSYIPAGRPEPGIWALPDGAKYYAFLIRRNTTTDLTADQIHQIGLDEVKKDEAAMLAIARKLGFADLKSFRASLETNPKLHPASAAALLNTYRGYLGPMEAKLPELFGRLPKEKLEVVPVPAYMAPSAPPAYYQPGAPDGSRPGRLFVNTYDAASRSLYGVEAIAYHEGVPGHHLQISIAQELTGVPAFRKYQQYTAYTEGWALYAEHRLRS